MFKRLVLSAAFVCCSTWAAAVPSLESPRALVLDASTGEVLLAKGEHDVASIASLTKLMTAMVVLDAGLNPYEVLDIEPADQDAIKGTKSGVPVGARFTRRTLLRLALLASDNRAAAALARTYPGGMPAFVRAVAAKAQALGLQETSMREPTGLSPKNQSSAADVARMLAAAAHYPEITDITSQRMAQFDVNGVSTQFHNTNRMVGSPGWKILLSKTGYTREAGLCLSMLLEEAGRKVLVVVMGAGDRADRASDVIAIKRWLSGRELLGPRAASKLALGATAPARQ
ncbi:serine hydrolase [Aquincola sp. S2]|uniref:Serine hydrolase n=1 Tax=Pseudaquabacterium terrae TaxID=2732868 RepID=A0ABX2EEP9_9BURK|nr:serine hydrolase [Aquabacterium terrae]NRF67100.1 serine hydrolase [Aquabacterium terrae]